MRLSLALVSALLLTSCAITGKTIKDVPKINAKNIHASPMSGLPKRSLSLNIVDSRSADVRLESTALVAELDRAITQALTREGITVQPNGVNNLVITVQDYATGKFKEGCVKILGALTVPQKAKLNAEASSCFELKSPFGFKMSADVTKAYEEALSLTFKNLDQALGRLNH